MERHIAERLMEILLRLDTPLNEATELTELLPDVAEQKAIRRGIGEVTLTIYTEIMRPIIRQFPDLDPEKNE
jgi:hypothetical protein